MTVAKSSLLSEIVASKKREILAKKKRVAFSQLNSHVRDGREPVSLEASLAGGERIIAEIKRRSPSSNSRRRALDPTEVARVYETFGAAAISVLTDGPRFGTTIGDLADVRRAVKLPVLRKDFIIEEYQVLESWRAGADALLLITRILTPSETRALLEMTTSLGMECLVEVHDEEDLEKALEAGARIIGTNNRDLDTLRVDLGVTETLVDKIPDDRLVVSESGIFNRGQIEHLSQLGVDAFLIGRALLDAVSIEEKLEELLGQEGRGTTGKNARKTGSGNEADS